MQEVVVGDRFGRLEVLRELPRVKSRRMVECLCDCGVVKSMCFSVVYRGRGKSCGCLQRELAASRLKTHGMTNSPEFRSWSSMLSRVKNKNVHDYHRYGGRGITICEEWGNSFEAFFSDMGSRPQGMTLDRKDVDGNYNKDNCRWITNKEQCRNRRNNHNITHGGKTMCITAWAELLRIDPAAITYHFKKEKDFQWIYDHFKERIIS